MERLPLSVLIGSEEEAVLYNDEVVAGLTAFMLTTDQVIKTSFTCVNCFPRPSGHRIRDIGKYPLRIRAGDDVNNVMLTYKGRPISALRELLVVLNAEAKRTIRVTTYTPIPEPAHTALLDLGVEVIVQPPDDTQAAGGEDAHL
jgi:hypothetical protein